MDVVVSARHCEVTDRFREHVEDNAGALRVRLIPEQVARIDAAFPAPERDVPLETI